LYRKQDTIMDILNLSKSKIKQDLLKLYFAHPEKQYYIRELARMLHRPAAYIRRELMNLEKIGLFTSEFAGKEKYFKLNQNFLFYKEVKSVVNKTIGIESRIKQILDKSKNIEAAYIFGSYAKDKLTPESDIDLLIIGQKDNVDIHHKIYGLQTEFDREINIIDMDRKEFIKRQKKKDEFISEIFANKIIKLI
jgi:predicted nucleotidyltransferase